jgi:hypothetical protein
MLSMSPVKQCHHMILGDYTRKLSLYGERWSDSSEEVPAYRIDLENTHMILAQACLGVL